jgi:diguanylate cyclase (GGDEF)-like protein/PAS domain S-box-containing protein
MASTGFSIRNAFRLLALGLAILAVPSAAQAQAGGEPAGAGAEAPGQSPSDDAFAYSPPGPHSVPVVVVDPAQPQVDLTSVIVNLPADREAVLPGPMPLVMSDAEADFARVWTVFALQNPLEVTQERILSINRTALWASGIAPVRSALSDLGAWRVTPMGQPLPQPVQGGTARGGDVRVLLTLPPRTTATFAIPFGATAPTPVTLWKPEALTAAEAGRASFAGLIVGGLAIAFAFFAAQWAQHLATHLRSSDSSFSGIAGHGTVWQATLLTGSALAYELAAQGYLGGTFGWSGGWDARTTAIMLALATGAAAHVLATERIRALSPDREQLARLAGWVALPAALLVLVLPSMGIPFVRLVAFSVALGGVAALTAGRSADDSVSPRLTPAAGELRAGWALIALAAILAALASQGFMPRSPAVEMIIHALGVLGILIAAYALAGPSTINAARLAARKSMAAGQRQGAGASSANAPTRMETPELKVPDATAIRAEQRSALALAGSGEAVWDLDVTSGMLYVDPSLEAHLGLVPGSLCGRLETWMARVHRDDRRHVSEVLDENVELGNASFSLEMRLEHADAGQGNRWLELRATCFAGEAGFARRVVGTVADITERHEAQAGLMRETLHDPLTGLANRPLFVDRLHRACIRAQNTHERIALVLADLDRFKQVNESLGHEMADTVLAALAQRLRALIAPEDTLARIDGDTFAMLVAGWSDDTGPADIARMVQEAIAQPLEVAGREVFPTASVGFTVREPHHDRGETLLGEADLALRLAKREGDTILEFRPDMRPVDDELATESGLRRALERGEIRLVYQPIVELASGQLAGFEALVRWRHPERGLISPDDFVPVAERSDLIIDIGSHVLDQAASDLATWQEDFPQQPPLFVSVNVSSRQLLDDLPGRVGALLEHQDLAPGSLRLEITESLVMNNPDMAARVLAEIRAFGVKLALDDFGTGYSSLSYLQRFPFDVVKIDKSFVQAMAQTEEPDAIVSSVLNLADGLRLSVVAEGIEDEDVRQRLQSLGCSYGQGFLFGQPMDVGDAHDFIARQQG